MSTESVSKRLQAIASEIPQQTRVADIGTDHGYLPIHLVKNHRAEWVLAADVNDGPLQTAANHVQAEGLMSHIETRVGSGLTVIEEEDEIDVVVIAGMGGVLIANILEEGLPVLNKVKRLVLQPNLKACDVRTWMLRHGWQLINEQIVEEDGRIYEILTAEKGDPLSPYGALEAQREAGVLFGPYLIKKQPAPFLKKWKREKENWKRVLQQLEHAADPALVSRKQSELERKINLLEEVLQHETS
ncbi:tRNA (adenine22-N1)-methyltransferase [Alteribacillus persepolensis]|uniref:tRNA (Adenine22-N1)-methyltransferase n=1 Tax=Alteribacillus persepolensis TaxID=568899 RepID=A0A1G8CSD1_9BACI|nr:tRNA (adenine(22)-N(1))-methyltransferase TrmK [Alteribacillus persepolensis]SDH48405.1 tRNA (adenine22-N1)-methyltransferase [Alteribacillus persepolensis]